MSQSTTLLIRTAGTNCDRELAHAFALAGSAVQTVHLHRLIESPELLEQVSIIALPGGFSYGDDIAAGRIFANRLRHRLLGPLREAIGRGALVLGVCNGFQVLVKLGLLPDPESARQVVTLADNARPRFVDAWVPVEADPASVCVWTRGLDHFELPIAHGEGRLVAKPGVIEQLAERGQVALRYARGHNPNGSMGSVAGLCDPTGRVLGLMPHPERYTEAKHHPCWSRRPGAGSDAAEPAGLRMLANAVAAASGQSVGTGA